MLEQRAELIAKARRLATMDDEVMAQQMVRTLLVDLAEALREADIHIATLEHFAYIPSRNPS